MKRIEPDRRMSQAVVHGDVVHLSGQVDLDCSEGIENQAAAVLARIDRLLLAAGTDRSNLLSVSVWLRSMDDFEGFNTIWDDWIDPGNPPARATVESRLARPEFLIEIAVIAGLRDDRPHKPDAGVSILQER